jgi:hypothetical protein
MSDRLRLSLDLLFVAIENLLLNLDREDSHELELAGLLTLAADMKESIAEYWQALDVDVVDELELGA